MPFQHGYVKRCSPIHSDLFTGCKYSLQSWMRKAVIIQNSKRICNRYSVISSQCSTLCAYIVSVYHKPKPILFKINVAVRLLFTHHIQVPLKDQRFPVLISCACFLHDYHVPGLILPDFQPMLFGKCHAVIADCLFVA